MNKLNPFKLYKCWVLADIISLMNRSVFIPVPKKDNAKECSNYYRIVLISHASRVMLQILQARLTQYVNWELPGVKLTFREGRGTRHQIANIHWFTENGRVLQKNIYFCSLTMLKPLTVDHKRLENSSRDGRKYQAALLVSWETCMQLKKQQLELDMEQWTGSKLRKEYDKAIYCHPAYLTYICRVRHVKCWAGWITSWNQDCWEKYQQPQICRWHHSNTTLESKEELKNLLMRAKEESEKLT